MPRLFPKLTASGLQAATYLCGIALFSISFLVFLNSSISFVVTEVIGQKKHVGDAVGTLGFADELLALLACPLWGMLSDRIGVRSVAVMGYSIVAFSLACLVQSTNVYPELLMGRLLFSLGGAACSTMVTAVLPAMVAEREEEEGDEEEVGPPNGHAARLLREEGRTGSLGHATSPSIASELTITPASYASDWQRRNSPPKGNRSQEETDEDDGLDRTTGTSQLAGLVGFFTGAGALVALSVFLPLPAYLQDGGYNQAQSVQISFYIVAGIALCVGVFIFFGLRNLPGEENKSFAALFQPPYDENTTMGADGHPHTVLSPAPSYFALVKESLKLGFTDPAISLGYLGGFVARASSVGISLFIPLFVNAYFVRTGLCTSNPDNLTDIKKQCERAYKLASALTGIGELAALICAPLFGWLGGRAKSEWPLLIASIIGVAGYVSFGLLRNPDAFHGDGGQWAFLSVILIGISQIGAIVCSLGLLGRGINKNTKSTESERPGTAATLRQEEVGPAEGDATAPLLPNAQRPKPSIDRSRLKGSIAGMYSLAGGAGILLLTKLGGALFDSWTEGAPFFLMAVFNALLVVGIVVVGGGSAVLEQQ